MSAKYRRIELLRELCDILFQWHYCVTGCIDVSDACGTDMGTWRMRLSVYFPYLGYGLLEAWSICMFYIRGDDFVLSGLAPGLPLLSIVSSLTVALGTLAIVIASHKRDLISHREALSLAAGFVNAIGSLLVLLASRPLAVVGGMVMASLANAWLWVSWGDVYSALDTEMGERTAIASATTQALVIAVALSVPAAARRFILVVLAPVASILYVLALGRVSQLDDGETDRTEHAPIDLTAKFVARMVVCLGGPIAILYYLINYHVVLPSMSSGLDITLLAGLLLFIVALVGFMRVAEGFSVGSICTITSAFLVATVVACGLGLSPSLREPLLSLLCCYASTS